MTIKFAQQLKKLRTERGLSQEDLAQKLFVSRQAVSRWEAGDATPDLETIVKITKIFDCSLDFLVFAQEPEKEQVVEKITEVPKESGMNFWEFLDRKWWLIFPLGGFLTWMIGAIFSICKYGTY